MVERNESLVPDEVLLHKIYLIRGEKVMLDRDLAELYGVETKVLKQAVRRNIKRFPEDFMFEMTSTELEHWRSQFVTSNSEKKGLRYRPFCFTEQGVTMLACVLNSDRAVQMNIRIVRIFTRMRKMMLTHADLLVKMEQLEKRITDQDDKVKLLFDYLRQFIREKETPVEKVGYRIGK
ncbi:MAG: ORF6N domain-containing protein [Flavobacteriales bacterium]|nr:ORF6N domain-containing protein [Flavobacteriales bacterium]MCB9447101.1 ORF6N domain-containing protein [Flavobacteriales bacterium]